MDEHSLGDWELIDFSVGYDDCVYLLFSRLSQKHSYAHIENTNAYFYTAVVIYVDWDNMCLIHSQSYPLGILYYNYHYLCPFDKGFLLLGGRCWNYFDGSEKMHY